MRLLSEQLITDAGLPVLSEQDAAWIAAGMRNTVEVAREEHRFKASVGVLHTPSQQAQQLYGPGSIRHVLITAMPALLNNFLLVT